MLDLFELVDNLFNVKRNNFFPIDVEDEGKRFTNGTEFVREGDSYVLTIKTNSSFTNKDVSVAYDEDERNVVVKTEYSYSNESGSNTFKSYLSRTLPEDADSETLNAAVANGVITIVVDVLPEKVEKAPEENRDTTHIDIKRIKNR